MTAMTRTTRFTGLWRHPDFLKLWSGQTISTFGTLVTRFALTLAAITILHASAVQVAFLHAAAYAPGLVLSLLAGVWVDRLKRRPLMIGADVGRALLLGSIPIAALVGRLTLAQLYLVELATSVLTVLFDVAYRAYLPALVGRDDLVEGNSKLSASSAVAEMSGFGLSGVLVQAFTAPGAILVDALSYVVSALSLAWIRTPETVVEHVEGADTAPGNALREIREGGQLVLSNRILRALAVQSATTSLCRSMIGVVIILEWSRTLHLTPLAMGLISSVGGVTSLIGVLHAERLTRRFGLGPTLVGALAVSAIGSLACPLAGGPWLLIVALLLVNQLVTDSAAAVHEVSALSLVQATAPERLQGRMNASIRCGDWAAMLVGLALGGLLGQVIGLRLTLLVGVLGQFVSVLWLAFSPVRAVRALPIASQPTPTDGLAG